MGVVASYVREIGIERKKEEERRDIYNFSGDEHKRIQTYTNIRHLRRRYRTNAVRDRCKQFAQDLEAEGFTAGNKLDRRELRYWIIALDLAHDKISVKQYLERLLIYGYFILDKHGKYVFCGSLKPGQLTLMDHRKVRAKIHMSLHQDRRIKRRAF